MRRVPCEAHPTTAAALEAPVAVEQPLCLDHIPSPRVRYSFHKEEDMGKLVFIWEKPLRASARAAAWAVEYHGHTRRLATRPMTPPPPPPGITPLPARAHKRKGDTQLFLHAKKKGPAVENPRCFELRPGLSTPLPDILALRFETESK
ncbi:uncharacterized protein CCOS01_11039 [Colletotrichum costaricense]|uniref:Uncharacterized protein n=1 Tax=Colletotrichum costaricense TaxID=1209916 RepID=A0AAI9YQC7_9PEZI|nr:uncharacterized protein CCOS01_11039 [Colletotrichum costaricense]KAK1519388.1 hypothetical protein CCOS01_11039 [Colletotrichum costaricense]